MLDAKPNAGLSEAQREELPKAHEIIAGNNLTRELKNSLNTQA